MSQCLRLFHSLPMLLLWYSPSLQPSRRSQSLPLAGDFTLLSRSRACTGQDHREARLALFSPLASFPLLLPF